MNSFLFLKEGNKKLFTIENQILNYLKIKNLKKQIYHELNYIL